MSLGDCYLSTHGESSVKAVFRRKEAGMAQHVAKRMETAGTPQRRPQGAQGAQGAHVPVALRLAAWRTKRM